jgi:beta-N-acetylhexosaminidase
MSSLSTILFGFYVVLNFFGLAPEKSKITQKSTETFIKPEEDLKQSLWVDSIFRTLTQEEKIGQLFFIRAHSDKNEEYYNKVENQIRDFKVGGLCFFQGTPEKQIELTNRYQAASKIPLLVSVDAEWGLSMRFKEQVIAFPKQLMLGAIQDNSLVYAFGTEVANQCKRLGIHVNFAPSADVNNNPNNPVIHERSFGENRFNVAAKSYMYMMGLQDHQIMACGKHFPGHGDTDVDSHLDLPLIAQSRVRLDTMELFPFRVLVQQGIQSMMIAHLSVPSLDPAVNKPTTLSSMTINSLLRKNMGFEGLIFTDAMEMKGVTKFFPEGEADAKAFQAGNDVILLPENVEKGITSIKMYLSKGWVKQSQLDESVKRILNAKYKAGLTRFRPISSKGVLEYLNRPESQFLKFKLIQKALTLVRSENKFLPVSNLDTLRCASISIGSKEITPFQNGLNRYVSMDAFTTENGGLSNVLDKLNDYNTIFVGVHSMRSSSKSQFGINSKDVEVLKDLSKSKRVIITLFGTPYGLAYFDFSKNIICAYNEDPMTQDLVSQAIFGAQAFEGKLPVTASIKSKFAQGITTKSNSRLSYGLPEYVGLNSSTLSKIDSLVAIAIDSSAIPGGQVLVIKDGMVVYRKPYGFSNYEKNEPISMSNLFDLASMTKILSTTVSLMKLKDEGKLELGYPISNYVTELKGTNKENATIYDILGHQAKFMAWIPFYKSTLDNKNRPDGKWYSPIPSFNKNIPVAKDLFLDNQFKSKLFQEIAASELTSSKKYKYSDLGFILFTDLVKNVSKTRLDSFAYQNFYSPLGMSSTMYNPWNKNCFPLCVPTETDNYFRHKEIKGYVHDMASAMMGGISGHAGLFSNADNVGIIMQMLLNGGYYGGKKYLDSKTIQLFTTRHQDGTRRGLGFDMFETDPSNKNPVTPYASPNTFGHTGFTGTCAWADPDNKIVFVFLSNRTFPSMDNNRFIAQDFRTRIQKVVYESMGKSKLKP